MCIITIKEFQSDPKRFIDLAEEQAVVITRDNGKPIKIEAIDSDDFFEVSVRKMQALTRQFLAPFGGGSKSLCRRCVPTRGVAH